VLVPFIRRRRGRWPAHRGQAGKEDSRTPNLYGQQPAQRPRSRRRRLRYSRFAHTWLLVRDKVLIGVQDEEEAAGGQDGEMPTSYAGSSPSCQPEPLRQHRPRRSLVGRMETARPQPGQPRLRVGHHRVPAAHLRPATPVDIQRQEPARLRRGCIKITLASQHHARDTPAWVTSASTRRQSPSAQNTVCSPGPAGSPASAAGVKPSQAD
jgi:hypothetical protein